MPGRSRQGLPSAEAGVRKVQFICPQIALSLCNNSLRKSKLSSAIDGAPDFTLSIADHFSLQFWSVRNASLLEIEMHSVTARVVHEK